MNWMRVTITNTNLETPRIIHFKNNDGVGDRWGGNQSGRFQDFDGFPL